MLKLWTGAKLGRISGSGSVFGSTTLVNLFLFSGKTWKLGTWITTSSELSSTGWGKSRDCRRCRLRLSLLLTVTELQHCQSPDCRCQSPDGGLPVPHAIVRTVPCCGPVCPAPGLPCAIIGPTPYVTHTEIHAEPNKLFEAENILFFFVLHFQIIKMKIFCSFSYYIFRLLKWGQLVTASLSCVHKQADVHCDLWACFAGWAECWCCTELIEASQCVQHISRMEPKVGSALGRPLGMLSFFKGEVKRLFSNDSYYRKRDIWTR